MLIDTGVWIDWLRGVETTATRILDEQLEIGEAWLAPVILQELLQGARSEKQLAELRREFGDQPMLTISPETYLRAGELYARLRWQGTTVRSPHDCLIAALAAGHGIPLLTLDRDFRAIAAIEADLVLVDSASC